jgi:hypothetical protein
MKDLADEYITKEKVNLLFTLKSIRIYDKPDPHGRYQTFLDIPLGR